MMHMSARCSKLKFGVRLPFSGPFSTPEALVKLAEAADDLGFNSIWGHGHIVWSSVHVKNHLQAGRLEAIEKSAKPVIFELLTTLSFLAGLTKRVQLGTSILILPFRNPIILARQAAVLDVLSGGRLILGVGLGALKNEFETLNIPWEKRGKIADEYIKAIRAMWMQPIASFNGEFISFSQLEVYPKPFQKPCPPIWIGGRSSYALRRTAMLGDGWLAALYSPEEIKKRINELEEYTKVFRRSLSEIEVSSENYLSITKKSEEARKISALTLKTRFNSIERGEEISLIGSPDDVMRKLEEYIRVGIKTFQFRIICRDLNEMLSMMKIFSYEVMPSF